MLTSKEILEEGLITGPLREDNISQVGIDLNVVKIERIGEGGHIPAKGKTKLAKYYEPEEKDGSWILSPGSYNVEFEQGCKIPSDVTLLIRQRSSLMRNGAFIHSSVFDPGFKTDSLGTVMIVMNYMTVEKGARLCQIYGHRHNPVEKLYDGQFQSDKQRKGK